jgi:hypothetical protein
VPSFSYPLHRTTLARITFTPVRNEADPPEMHTFHCA